MQKFIQRFLREFLRVFLHVFPQKFPQDLFQRRYSHSDSLFKKFRNFTKIYLEISHAIFLGFFTKVQVLLQKFLRASFKNTITNSSRNSFSKTSIHFIWDFFRNISKCYDDGLPLYLTNFFHFLYFSFILIRFGYKISLFFHISWSFFFFLSILKFECSDARRK